MSLFDIRYLGLYAYSVDGQDWCGCGRSIASPTAWKRLLKVGSRKSFFSALSILPDDCEEEKNNHS